MPNAKSNAEETALDWAMKFGNPAVTIQSASFRLTNSSRRHAGGLAKHCIDATVQRGILPSKRLCRLPSSTRHGHGASLRAPTKGEKHCGLVGVSQWTTCCRGFIAAADRIPSSISCWLYRLRAIHPMPTRMPLSPMSSHSSGRRLDRPRCFCNSGDPTLWLAGPSSGL